MTQPLDAACTAIAAVVRGVSGIRQAPDYAQENPNAWPQAVVFPQSGNFQASPVGTRKGLHNIIIDVLIPEQQSDLTRQMQTLIPLVDTIPAALIAEVSDNGDLFSKTVSTFEQVEYTYIVANYAATPCRGYRFTMRNVKILTNT